MGSKSKHDRKVFLDYKIGLSVLYVLITKVWDFEKKRHITKSKVMFNSKFSKTLYLPI
jgi:hypothetical protein